MQQWTNKNNYRCQRQPRKPKQFWSKIRLPNCRKGVVCYTIVCSSRMYICTYICSLWGKTIHTCHYYISAISSSICTMYCFSFTYSVLGVGWWNNYKLSCNGKCFHMIHDPETLCSISSTLLLVNLVWESLVLEAYLKLLTQKSTLSIL